MAICSFLRIARALIALTAIPHFVTQTEAQTQLCFTDEQLRSVLVSVHFFSVGQMAGTCAGRFPELVTQAMELTQRLESTYNSELATIDRLSIDAFEQHYPGHGKEMRDRNENVASEPSRLAAQKFSREECENVLSTLEGFAVANDWAAVTYPPLTFFDQERTRVPRC